MKTLLRTVPLSLLLLLPLTVSHAASSPEPTARESQTEQYAMVIASGKLLSLTKWKVEVTLGKNWRLALGTKTYYATKMAKPLRLTRQWML